MPLRDIAANSVSRLLEACHCTRPQLLVAVLLLMLHAFHNIGLCVAGMSPASSHPLLEWHIYYFSIVCAQGVIVASWVTDGSGALVNRICLGTLIGLILGTACSLGIISNRGSLGMDEVVTGFFQVLQMWFILAVVYSVRCCRRSPPRAPRVALRFTLASQLSVISMIALLLAVIAGLVRSGVIVGRFYMSLVVESIIVVIAISVLAGPAFLTCGMIIKRCDPYRPSKVILLTLSQLVPIAVAVVLGSRHRLISNAEIIGPFLMSIIVIHLTAMLTVLPFRYLKTQSVDIGIAPNESDC